MTTILRPRRFRRSHRPLRRLKSLAFAPTLLTLGNLLFGFAAIYFAMRAVHDIGLQVGRGQMTHQQPDLPWPMSDRLLPSFLSLGGWLIVCGMLCDAFDGLVARATRSASPFGAQLDSLADVVTCGVAPAMLMIAFMTTELVKEKILPSPISDSFLGRFTWLSAALYACFAALRLARFNAEHAEVKPATSKADAEVMATISDGAEEDSGVARSAGHDTTVEHARTPAKSAFTGLPSPGAAGLMAALVGFQDLTTPALRQVVMYLMPIIAIGLGCLMVSRIPYPRSWKAYVVGRQPFHHVIVFLLFAAVFLSHRAWALLIVAGWYVASGPVAYGWKEWKQRRAA